MTHFLNIDIIHWLLAYAGMTIHILLKVGYQTQSLFKSIMNMFASRVKSESDADKQG